MTTSNPYAIEKRTASDSEDNVSVVSTHDGDTYDSDRPHNFWTRIMFIKLVDACKELQDYLDNKWWQKITGENVIEDTLKEFQDARKTLLKLALKAIEVIDAADGVRKQTRQWEQLYEYNDNEYDSGEDTIGVQDHQLSHMIQNAKRLHDIAEEIVRIALEHESEAGTHFLWLRFNLDSKEGHPDMSDEFLKACYQRRQDLREKNSQERIDRGEDPDANECAIQ
jgi:hypothetical protein